MGTLERPNEPRPVTVVREARLDPSAQGGVRFVSMLLLAAVGLVLLIVCANVANLMIVRTPRASPWIAILRTWAGGRRLVRQLLTASPLAVLWLRLFFWRPKDCSRTCLLSSPRRRWCLDLILTGAFGLFYLESHC